MRTVGRVVLVGASAVAIAESAVPADAGAVDTPVRVWLSTGDQTKQLSEQAPTAFSGTASRCSATAPTRPRTWHKTCNGVVEVVNGRYTKNAWPAAPGSRR